MAYILHHYLPQFYLRKFTDPKRRHDLWQYDKSSNEITVSTPRDCGCQQHLYSFRRSEDKVWDNEKLEQAFQRRETNWAALYSPLRRKRNFNAEERETFVTFVTLMKVRGPHWMGIQRAIISPWFKETLVRMKRDNRFLKYCTNRGVPHAAIQSLTIEPTQDFVMTEALKTAPVFHKRFQQMTWRFFEAPPNSFFVTGDNPVVYRDEQTGLLALRSRNAEVTFPLSRNLCAVGDWSNRSAGGSFVTITVAELDRINNRTIEAAETFAYGPRNCAKVAEAVRRSKGSAPTVRVHKLPSALVFESIQS